MWNNEAEMNAEPESGRESGCEGTIGIDVAFCGLCKWRGLSHLGVDRGNRRLGCCRGG